MRRRVASEETERALPGFAKPTRTQTTRATRATNYEGSVSVFRFQGGGRTERRGHRRGGGGGGGGRGGGGGSGRGVPASLQVEEIEITRLRRYRNEVPDSDPMKTSRRIMQDTKKTH